MLVTIRHYGGDTCRGRTDTDKLLQEQQMSPLLLMFFYKLPDFFKQCCLAEAQLRYRYNCAFAIHVHFQPFAERAT